MTATTLASAVGILWRPIGRIFNLRSQLGSCCGDFVAYTAFVYDTHPVTIAVLRTEHKDTVCRSADYFLFFYTDVRRSNMSVTCH